MKEGIIEVASRWMIEWTSKGLNKSVNDWIINA